jgi:hypothetical protein
MVLKPLDEQSKLALIKWFSSPIRYYLKLLHEDTINDILQQEKLKQSKESREGENS